MISLIYEILKKRKLIENEMRFVVTRRGGYRERELGDGG